MIPMMMLALGGRRDTVTETFTIGTVWTAPAGVTQIDTLLGKGGSGTPGTDDHYGPAPQLKIYHHYLKRRDGGPDDVTTSTGPAPTSEWPTGAPRPDGGSTITDTPESTVYYQDVFIWSYAYGDPPLIPGTPATTGGTTTAFGKSFAGGYGGPAAPTTLANIAVTPGASYNLVIPAGGLITITYQK